MGRGILGLPLHFQKLFFNLIKMAISLKNGHQLTKPQELQICQQVILLGVVKEGKKHVRDSFGNIKKRRLSKTSFFLTSYLILIILDAAHKFVASDFKLHISATSKVAALYGIEQCCLLTFGKYHFSGIGSYDIFVSN